MSERTAEATTTVDEDGIRVEKSFTDEAFPVPAVMYELSSDRDEPARVRIVDGIPESFPMDRIGFHPEYESGNWTAYKDHRVEFERVLDPGEAIETVFGIRDDDPDLDSFLGTPVIEHVPVGEEIEDVLGASDTDAVREVLSGDREALPGMEEPLAAEVTESDVRETKPDVEPVEHATEGDESDETHEASVTTGDDPDAVEEGTPVADDASTSDDEPAPDATPSPRDVVESGTAAVTPQTPEDGADEEAESGSLEADERAQEGDEHEPQAAEDDSAAAEDGAAATDDATDDEPEPATAATDAESEEAAGARAPAASEGSLAATLASEIRSGDVEEDDLETLRSELDIGVPNSVDVRIARLQSSVADIEAYADALAEFIDGEGTAREILDELDRKVDAVESEMATLDDRLDEAAATRDDIRGEVSRIDESVDAVSGGVDDVTERVDLVTDRVGDVEGDVSTVEEDVADVESSVSDVEESVETVETTVSEATDDVSRIDGDVADLSDSVAGLGDDVETLYEQVDDTAAGLEATEERVDGVESRLERFDEEFDDLWGDLAEVDTRLTEIEDRLGEDLDDVQAEIDGINDHLDELDAFRTRLNEAFGP